MSNNPKTENIELIEAMKELSIVQTAGALRECFNDIQKANKVEVIDYSKTPKPELIKMRDALLGTTPKAPTIKADTTTEAKSIHTMLNSITQDKATIKAKHESINSTVKEVIPMITDYVKQLRDEDKVYKDAKKVTLVKLIKLRLGSKEHVVNTVCDVMILGLNIDNTISLSSMALIVKCVNNGTFSKAQVNKADKAGLEAMVTKQHKVNRINIAKKLITNDKKEK